MGLAFYLTGTNTLKTSFVFTGACGADSAVVSADLWCNKGTPGAALKDIAIIFKAKTTGGATYLDHGLPILDDHWTQFRVTGGTNPSNDPLYVPFSCDWLPLGTDAIGRVPNLPGNCSYALEFKQRPPLDAVGGTYDNDILAVPDVVSSTVSPGLAGLGQGIVSGIRDLTVFEFVDAPILQARGTPDDYSEIVAPSWASTYSGVLRGVYYSWAVASHQHNQNDGAAAALTSGQAYIVTVSQGTGGVATYTKGIKAAAASALAPTAPAGELVIGTVKVRYQAGTTNIISSDVTIMCISGRFRVELSGAGLTATVNPGRAILPGAYVSRTSRQTASLVDASTNRIWLSGGGGVVVNQSATPPSTGLQLLATAVTSGGAVSSIDTTMRRILAPAPLLDGDSVSTALATSGAQNVDCSLGDLFTITPVGASTLTFTNIRPGQLVSVICLTSGTTPYTISFDSTAITEDPNRDTGATSGVYFHWLFRGIAGGKMLEVVYSVALT